MTGTTYNNLMTEEEITKATENVLAGVKFQCRLTTEKAEEQYAEQFIRFNALLAGLDEEVK